jgi:NADPH:quinone reductase-like Zn-dependent oxidoreductase
MKAFVLRSYGSPDVLDLTDIDKPVPGDDEVLVRVRATSVNPYDWHNLRGEPCIGRLLGGLGLRNPKLSILGADMAGQVEAVGKDVTEFRPGDEVFAMLEQGGFAEYGDHPVDTGPAMTLGSGGGRRGHDRRSCARPARASPDR